MNKTLSNILTRTSCRSFSEKKVPSGKLKQILEAGKFAPSGRNRQICNILVIKSKSKLDKVRAALNEKFNRDCLYGVNTLCVVYGLKDEPLVVQDGSCILENMFIAANALNIDSCWINQLEDLLSDPDYSKFRKILGIEPEYRVIGCAALGYRKEGTVKEVKPRKDNFIRYI